MKDRPSRIRYYKQYNELDTKIIREICGDLLDNKEFTHDLMENLPIKNLNIDVLIQIITEINIHNKPYSEFKDFFNFKETGSDEFKVYYIENGEEVILRDEYKPGRATSVNMHFGYISDGESSIRTAEAKVLNTEGITEVKAKIVMYNEDGEEIPEKEQKSTIYFKKISSYIKSVFRSDMPGVSQSLMT